MAAGDSFEYFAAPVVGRASPGPFQSLGVVTIPDGVTNYSLPTIKLGPPAAPLRGRLMDADGTPLAGAKLVGISQPRHDWHSPRTTDRRGRAASPSIANCTVGGSCSASRPGSGFSWLTAGRLKPRPSRPGRASLPSSSRPPATPSRRGPSRSRPTSWPAWSSTPRGSPWRGFWPTPLVGHRGIRHLPTRKAGPAQGRRDKARSRSG